MDIKAMFAAKQVSAPTRGDRDAITLFKSSIQTQLRKIDALKKDNKAPIAATNWFKRRDGGYLLHLGKKPIELNGGTHWEVDSLEELEVLLNGAKELADTDKEFQKAIKDAKKASDKTEAAATATPQRRSRKPRSAA